jgi:hypothetical protein
MCFERTHRCTWTRRCGWKDGRANVGAFVRFLEAISFSHASVLNAANVARECQVERKTIAAYVEVLEDLLLSFRVPVITRCAKRETSTHLNQTGLCPVPRLGRSRGPSAPLRSLAGAPCAPESFHSDTACFDRCGRKDRSIGLKKSTGAALEARKGVFDRRWITHSRPVGRTPAARAANQPAVSFASSRADVSGGFERY